MIIHLFSFPSVFTSSSNNTGLDVLFNVHKTPHWLTLNIPDPTLKNNP